ncbi:Rieske 2Fe-2S domain-containing protein [Prauserella cavernicola]|uniref:Rieske (2Fe-2S) protein n=1 Tax=Prauserella cavernicola TaxID=2800127 RepID=A0A934QQT4_9PSEU|nr:Rieske (2Fe-2S) protein [Prauserella cavernicola]MBK1783773.1 Rieske (2Fe-2S) protein [Prauserella cavernicola]
MRPFDDIARLAEQRRLDRAAALLRVTGEKVLRSRRLRDTLHGVWLGHPLHPALVQAPMGAFVSSAVADACRGGAPVADALIRVGLVTSLPAAAAGTADYLKGHEEQQRVAVVHAAGNAVGLLCFVASLRLRGRGHRAAGAAASLAGLSVLGASAAIGGHLSYHFAMGANHTEAVPHTGPGEWTDLVGFAELPDRSPVKRFAGDVPVVLVRTGSQVDVLADTCSHTSGPLHDGELLSENGGDCLRCPWHGSVFRLADGAVVHGPATAPQPRFHARVVDGRVQARVRTFAGVPTAG